MLEALDDSKRSGHLQWNSDTLGPSVLTVSLYGVKLTGQHSEVQLKVPLNEIASANVCEDDNIWYIFLKTGTGGQVDTYKCHVCEFGLEQDAMSVAELIRSNVESAFVKVGMPFNKLYAEPRETLAEHSAAPEALYASAGPPSGRASLEPPEPAPEADPVLDTRERKARIRLASRPLSESPEVNWGESPSPPPSPTRPESPVVEAFPIPQGPVNTTEMVAAYMEELRSVLTQAEIREFASLLRALRFKSLQLDDFCMKLKTLFGDDRTYVSLSFMPLMAMI